ncbi:MAG: hypothetical protein CMI56_02875 [Parcubacteria group bacterium]|nr:hypothetical protein [Parcubacteria group bacterium]|tara:strand:- start:224 stop:685 length:462 start_codon:yes stop_codon:yes gene_type:complete
MPQNIVWKAYEHSHTDKGSDWFWALGIVAFSSALVAALFQNFLFALLILVGTFTLALLSARPPRKLEFALTPQGVRIDNALYPYQMLISFWIKNRETDHAELIIDARKFMTPHIIASLEETDVKSVQAYLEQFLPEEELEEPFVQRLLEKFGF